MLAAEAVGDRRHLQSRMLRRRAWLQPPEDLQRANARRFDCHPFLATRPERAGDRRHVDVTFLRIERYRRQDTDHRVRPVVHLKDLSDDLRSPPKPRLPVPVAQQQHRLGAVLLVGGDEIPAGDGRHAEDVEEV